MNSTEAAAIPTNSTNNNGSRVSTSPSALPTSSPGSGISTQNVLFCIIIVLAFILSFIFGVKIRRAFVTGQGNFEQRRRGHLESAPSIGARLDETTIDLLMPTFTYNSKLVIRGHGINIILKESDEEEVRRDDQCAVCLCEFKEGEELRLVPKCEHRFHSGCIDMWFHSHTTCPLCRTPVLIPLI